MTAAGPATSTVLSPLPDQRRLSSQGPVVRQGLAKLPPERWRRAAGTLLSSTSTPTALYDLIARFFGRLD
jgi:hypothetical protein